MKRKTKVLFVIDSLDSGGAEKSLVTFLSTLDFDIYDVDLFLLKKEGLYLSLVPNSVNVSKIEFSPILLQKILFSVLLKVNRFFSFFVKERKFHPAQLYWSIFGKCYKPVNEEYDVAVAYSQGFPTYFVASKIQASKKICWINTNYNKALYRPSFDLGFYRKFDKIVLVSDEAKNVFLTFFSEFKHKLLVMYDIISEKLVLEMSKAPIKTEGFKGVKILTIGRLVPVKGYDIALQAAYLLKQKGINFKWSIIGEGVLKEQLKSEIKKLELQSNVFLLGTYTNPYPYLRECDIYCQTSKFEGFGMAIAEAKILNKPVVSTNFEIVHNQIINNINGIITKMEAESFFRGIMKLICEKDLKEKIIENLKAERSNNEAEIFKINQLLKM